MSFQWPASFARVPDAEWSRQDVGDLARKYDTVENHGWYDNLELTVEQIGRFIRDGDILLDYSGGTGILAARLLDRFREREFGILIVDSSPKFLRLALEKFRHEPRLAFRHIRYLKEEGRLETVDEVLDPPLLDRRVDALVSSNAIHLYFNLPETIRAWRHVLRPDGRVFIQSGNIRNPDMPAGEWIIDETVEAIHRAAISLVRTDSRWAAYRTALDDADYMAAHDALRRKYFLPVRPLSYYVDVLTSEGFEVLSIERATIPARVDQWYEFLRVYHEGALGWVGGARKVTGHAVSPAAEADRVELMRRGMEKIFGGQQEFAACWTYLTCEPVQ